jgi:hypothetical protein
MRPRTLPKYSYMFIAFTQWQQNINFVHGYSLLKTAVGRKKLTENTMEVTSILHIKTCQNIKNQVTKIIPP